MAETSAIRTARWRDRQRNQQAVIQLCVDRTVLHEILKATGAIDRSSDDDTETLTAGMQKLIAKLQEQINQ